MYTIALNGDGWNSEVDFYSALLQAIEAPDWHGRNMDALWDSITGGDINGKNIPFKIQLFGYDSMGKNAKITVDRFVLLVLDAKNAGYQVELIYD